MIWGHVPGKPGDFTQMVDAHTKSKADDIDIQQMRWMPQGGKCMGSFEIYYTCHINSIGLWWMVGERAQRRILTLTPLVIRLAAIRVKVKFFNETLICVLVPTEKKYNK